MPQASQTSQTPQTQMDSPKPSIEDKILHVLDIYPIISPSMLQVGLGAVPALEWKPILRELIEANKVLEVEIDTTTVTGRYFTYTKLLLPSNAYIIYPQG